MVNKLTGLASETNGLLRIHRPVTWCSSSPRGLPMDATSLSLLERARGRVNQAWDRLVALYQPLIYNSLRSHGLPHHAAEEVTQQVLLVVFRELEDFTHPGA